MSYTDGDDIAARITAKTIVELTDDEALARGVNFALSTALADAIVLNAAIQTRIDAAIADADTTVNTYVRKQAKTPVLTDQLLASSPSNTPQTVRQISAQLSIFNLYARRRGEFELPEAVVDKKRGAIKVLELINKGMIDIGDQPQPAESDSVLSEASGDTAAFTNTTLEDF